MTAESFFFRLCSTNLVRGLVLLLGCSVVLLVVAAVTSEATATPGSWVEEVVVSTVGSSSSVPSASPSGPRIASQTNVTKQERASSSKCGVYMAPSTIPGAGVGMFAGREYHTSETLTPGDVVIPIADFGSHNSHIDIEYLVLQSYYWLTVAFTGMSEEFVDGYAFSPGAGAAVNCFFPLINLQGADSETKMDCAGLHRSKDPGAGAFTLFHGRYSYATRNIRPGEELFADYGPNYFVHNEEVYGQIPLYESYDYADKMLTSYVKARNRVCNANQDSSPQRQQQQQQQQQCHKLHDDWYGMLRDLKSIWPSRTLNALPDDPTVVDEIAEIGTAYTHYNRSIRSIEWLEEHGQCMDHLVAGPSTIPQAGRGAFAQRFLNEGTVIAPSPLVHLERNLMDLYPLSYDEYGELWGDRSAPVQHQQLLLNYCFGHSRTQVILCPYGMLTSLINHSKNRPNAKIEWNYRFMKNPEWLSLPLEEWIYSDHVGLVLNYVATRDIQPGEEILIDYGDEWDNAWRQHVSSWKPPQRASQYFASYDLNENPALIVRTISEGSYSASDVEMFCFDIYREWSGLKPSTSKDMHYCRAVDRYVRSDGEYRYTVELFHRRSGSKKDQHCYERMFEVLFDIPRDAFLFTDAPYSRDTAQPWSFRHPVGIPDSLLPEAWTNSSLQHL